MGKIVSVFVSLVLAVAVGTSSFYKEPVAVVAYDALPALISALDTVGSDGDTHTSRGYYAIDDGGHLTYRYSTTSTEPADGVDANHPGLVYRPSSISAENPGRWIAQVDRSVINSRWFGVKADGSHDDTLYLQAAIERAMNRNQDWDWGCHTVTVPNGLIKTTDTIHLGYGTSTDYSQYTMITLRSDNKRGGYFIWGTQFKPTFNDRPVINVQGGRHCSIEGIGIIGTYATTSINGGTPANESVWDAAVSTAAKKQYCGIAVDAYSGTEPASGGYTNAPEGWSKSYTSDLKIRDCYISNFGCGVIIKPSGGDANGDYVELHDCHVEACKYGFSVNSSQARGNRAINCKFIHNYSAVGVGFFGPNLGRDVFLDGCAIEGCTWMIKGVNTDWIGKYVIDKCFGERVCGIIDLATAGGNCNVSVTDNSMLMVSADSTSEVRQHINTPACGLIVSGNRFVNEGVTRPSVIVRCGTQSLVNNNVMVRIASGYSSPKLTVIPSNSSTTKLQSYNNTPTNLGDTVPAPGIAGVLLTTASYTGSKRYSGISASILWNASASPARSRVAANDIIAVTRTGDSVTMLFKVITAPTSQFATVVLEQINDCDGTNPLSSSETLTRIGTSGLTYILKSREPVYSGSPIL